MTVQNTILITGANRGIGLELARRAAERGDQVIATARAPDAADRLRAVAKDTGRIEIEALDVVDETSLSALADRLTGRPIDLLVANAGVLRDLDGLDPTADYADARDREDWSDVLMTNIFGPYAAVRALLPNLRAGEGKKIAIISSAMGSSARAPGAEYSYRASKAAATNLARNLATDLKPHGFAVGAYHPGWVRTDMGGASADISVQESAAGLLARFDALSPATTGVFESYDGAPVAF